MGRDWDHRLDRLNAINTFTDRLAATMSTEMSLDERLKIADPDGSLTKAYNDLVLELNPNPSRGPAYLIRKPASDFTFGIKQPSGKIVPWPPKPEKTEALRPEDV